MPTLFAESKQGTLLTASIGQVAKLLRGASLASAQALRQSQELSRKRVVPNRVGRHVLKTANTIGLLPVG